MVAGNLYALQQFFNVNWSAKWVAKPTFKALELQGERENGDYLYYSGGKPVETPVGNGWIDRKENFKFLLRSTTQGNVELMFEELKYMAHNLFYPAPFTPVSHESEVLAYYDCNYTGDGAGDHLHDYQATYDLTFGAPPPTWVTTGALNKKNFLRLAATALLTNNTLLDTAPSALTLEVLCQSSAITTIGYINKDNTATSYLTLFIQQQTGDNQHLFQIYKTSTTYSIQAGRPPYDKWINVMATAGARGMELYRNGILVGTNAYTGVLDNGTTADFKVKAAGNNLDLSVLRVSSVQRLPWDPHSLTLALKDVQHGPGYYQAECEIVGTLSNIYVGGSL